MKIIQENLLNNMKIIITFEKHMKRNENHTRKSYETYENHNKYENLVKRNKTNHKRKSYETNQKSYKHMK